MKKFYSASVNNTEKGGRHLKEERPIIIFYSVHILKSIQGVQLRNPYWWWKGAEGQEGWNAYALEVPRSCLPGVYLSHLSHPPCILYNLTTLMQGRCLFLSIFTNLTKKPASVNRVSNNADFCQKAEGKSCLLGDVTLKSLFKKPFRFAPDQSSSCR